MLPSSHYINKQEALFKFPMLNPDGLKGALAVSCVGRPCVHVCVPCLVTAAVPARTFSAVLFALLSRSLHARLLPSTSPDVVVAHA